MTDEGRDTHVAQAAQRARDAGGHRVIWIAWAIVVGAFGVLALVVVTLLSRVDSLSADAQTLYGQVRELGGTPKVAPPTAAVGPIGPIGAQGPQGVQGEQGQSGKDGQSPPCLSTPAQCQGVNGKDGAPGTPGVDGVDGKDGATGQPGKDGANGATGPQGPPGPTCPDGYAPGPAIIVSPDGSTHQGLACIQNAPPTSSTKARKG